jgi:hypothetical protein
LKRASMRLLASGSGLVFFSSILLLGQGNLMAAQGNPSPKHEYEWKLAGALTGHSTAARAPAILREPFWANSEKHLTTWTTCQKAMEVKTDRKGFVRVVTVWTTLYPWQGLHCFGSATGESKRVSRLGWGTGDSTEQVMKLYGQPDSRSPSTRGTQQLELLHYTFAWAGPDVPQVMEVLCTLEKDGKPGRVVEIKLAASGQ